MQQSHTNFGHRIVRKPSVHTWIWR